MVVVVVGGEWNRFGSLERRVQTGAVGDGDDKEPTMAR